MRENRRKGVREGGGKEEEKNEGRGEQGNKRRVGENRKKEEEEEEEEEARLCHCFMYCMGVSYKMVLVFESSETNDHSLHCA